MEDITSPIILSSHWAIKTLCLKLSVSYKYKDCLFALIKCELNKRYYFNLKAEFQISFSNKESTVRRNSKFILDILIQTVSNFL